MLDDLDKRRARNCNNEFGVDFFVEWDPDLRECPKSYLTEDVFWMIQAWLDYEKFEMLPFKGGIDDQPGWVYDLFWLCDNTKAKIEKEIENANACRMRE